MEGQSSAQRVRLALVALLLGAVLVAWWVWFRRTWIREGKEEKVRSQEALQHGEERQRRLAALTRGRRATTLLVREDVTALTELLATLQPGGARTLALTIERGDGRPLATEANVVNSTDDPTSTGSW